MRNVLEYLEVNVMEIPDKHIAIDHKGKLTFGELYVRAQQIGTYIATFEMLRHPIVVLMEKGVDTLCSFMGIVYSGNFYVFIDPIYPNTRIAQIMNVLETRLVITNEEGIERLNEIEYKETVIDYETIQYDIDMFKLKQIREQATDKDPLYCNFTSGSTGVPKGVLVSHGSVIDFIDYFTEIFGINHTDVLGNQAPFDFDVSVKDIYSCLKTGACLVVIPREEFMFPQQVMDRIETYNITILVWAVSAMCMVSRLHGLEYKAPPCIRQIMFSGEKMPIKQLNKWRQYYPNVRFVNLYGPTEITCNCTYHILDRVYKDDDSIPIGRAFPNEKVFLIDDNQLVIEPFKKGEICVAGTGVALGYYKNEAMTRKAFCLNPTNQYYDELIYKTGDIGFYNQDGLLYFCGRTDFQIKHMGHRIELEEIELHINAIEGVEQSCCFYDQNKNKIIACYVGNVDAEDIIAVMKQKVSEYLIPNVFRKLEEFPLNNNGKMDRKRLKKEYVKGELKDARE